MTCLGDQYWLMLCLAGLCVSFRWQLLLKFKGFLPCGLVMIIHEQLLWLVPFKCGVWNFWILLRSSFLLLYYDEILMSTVILWGWPGWRYFMFWFYPDLLLVGDGHVTSVATESIVVRLMLLIRQYFLYFNLAFNSCKTFISSLKSLQTFLFLFWRNFCFVSLNCCNLWKFNWVAALDWRLD